ncbi:MBL fold metallo-hydrolase [Mangrovibacterium diazotrophicum]|uniref:L-ascorbate metabolism protein UlaG (Beta-lactamase superfamily) n=1 Tax=Mangrovibacterium diazotrophicum TaxID=1261403 RepID=A0A419W5M3_9BACT|nr:MBL fold metallo-hydrolase [Mangrovibacterium diazotrophicum]RKD90747.1 L-ascorbate metabolism protein UlaG (beta-lactamase superfamily) [Mangrovibacterium diazotrophicum]
MKRTTPILLSLILLVSVLSGKSASAQYRIKDVIPTSKGDLEITIIGHCFYHFTFNRLNIYVDPIPNVGDISALPKADLILITHDHRDHLSTNVIQFLSKYDTKVIASKACIKKMDFGEFLENGQQTTFGEIYIKAVPAYNVVNLRPDDVPYHPKGDGNGYFLVFGDKTVYIAGDTEYIDEMRFFMKPDIAFIPMMMPFCMDEDMFIKVAKRLKPEIIYPVHYNTKLDSLVEKMKIALPNTEVKIR